MYIITKPYVNGQGKCILVMEEDGSCWCKLTVSIPEVFLEANQVIINSIHDKKTIGILNKLHNDDILSYTNRTVRSGYNTYKIANIRYDKLKTYGRFN